MLCTTIRKDNDCIFMSQKGCTYNKGVCSKVIDKCLDCKRKKEFETGWFCNAFPEPDAKWKNGNCNLATHLKATTGKVAKAKINPLKASKRGKH